MFPAQEPHLPCLWAAWAEPLRFPKAEQVQPSASEIYSSYYATSMQMTVSSWDSVPALTTFVFAGIDRAAEAEAVGSDSRGFEAGKHHVGWSGPTAISC